MCSCLCCFKSLFYCKCKNFEENKKYEIRDNNDVNKIERIVVIYRVIGRWIWLEKMMTEIQVYP